MILRNKQFKFQIGFLKSFGSGSSKTTRKWLIIGNVVLLLGVATFVISNRSASDVIRSNTLSGDLSSTNNISPLDQLSSSQIAYQAAILTKIPEVTMAANRADSETALLSIVPSDERVLAKPLTISASGKSAKDIIVYTAVENDTVGSVAVKFGIGANSIKWSNNLTTVNIPSGTRLFIPPGEGIVYQAKAGDTVGSLVSRYQVDINTFIAVNDAENGISPGMLIWIPGGVQPLEAGGFRSVSQGSSEGGFQYTGPCIYNTYDCGWCTWWSAYRRSQIGHPVPGGLGDAISWAAGATRLGVGVGLKPVEGSVIWFPGANHVGFVETVNPDGSIFISEMHVYAYNQVTYRTIPGNETSKYKYIY